LRLFFLPLLELSVQLNIVEGFNDARTAASRIVAVLNMVVDEARELDLSLRAQVLNGLIKAVEVGLIVAWVREALIWLKGLEIVLTTLGLY
jgi:hypothetical protein